MAIERTKKPQYGRLLLLLALLVAVLVLMWLLPNTKTV